jgi:hypothetical protein
MSVGTITVRFTDEEEQTIREIAGEQNLQKCGGVIFDKGVFVFPFSARLLNSGNFDLK